MAARRSLYAALTILAVANPGTGDAAAQPFADRARTLPPQFKADVLIRIADSGKIRSRRTVSDLLEEAFYAADGAEEPVTLDLAGASRAGMRDYIRARSFANGLARLSLQSRVLRLLAAVDLKKARELAGALNLHLPPLKCEDPLVYNVDAVYKDLTVYTSALPDVDRFVLVQRYITTMTSPAQVDPMAQLLVNVAMPRDERILLAQSFAAELGRIGDDDRTFTAVIEREKLPTHIKDFIEQLRRQAYDPGALVIAFRTYLVKHFNARRCADGADTPDLRMMQWFNDDLRLMTTSDVRRINDDDYRGRRSGARAVAHEMDASGAEYVALTRELSASLPVRPERATVVNGIGPDVRTPERLVGDVLVWQGRGERSQADFLYKKATMLQRLLAEALPGVLHDIVLGELVTFLSYAWQGVERQIEWFLEVNTLLEYGRRAGKAEQAKVLKALQDSSNAIMSTYGGLERYAPLRLLKE
jgi:hypothetical protein